jgi:protein-L-isoaspartate(D-aspartate) O-methyltransferase
LLEVPRERFVRAEDVERSAEDMPLPLDDLGLATISAPHAYLLSFRLLELGLGDRLVELGTGSGYGAALAAFIVGEKGRVITFEIDHELAAWAERTLAHEPTVTVVEADAVSSADHWEGAKKVVATFALDALPDTWLDALPEGGRLVAPVGSRDADQRLVLAVRRHDRVIETDHGAVRYVKNRSTR